MKEKSEKIKSGTRTRMKLKEGHRVHHYLSQY
jgi:hypothetical protein